MECHPHSYGLRLSTIRAAAAGVGCLPFLAVHHPVRVASGEERPLRTARGDRLATYLRGGLAGWDWFHDEPVHLRPGLFGGLADRGCQARDRMRIPDSRGGGLDDPQGSIPSALAENPHELLRTPLRRSSHSGDSSEVRTELGVRGIMIRLDRVREPAFREEEGRRSLWTLLF